MAMNMRAKINEACKVSEYFTKLYYGTIDKNRHLVSKLYMDNGILTWNGNGIEGPGNIQKFILNLPRSEHMLATYDAQPIIDKAVCGQNTILIQVSGAVKYKNMALKQFQQNFMIIAQGDKWKIVSDCFRWQEPIKK